MEFTLQTTIPAKPSDVYLSWLSSEGHSQMTGGEAICSDQIGGTFSAWDGYIEGTNLALEEDHRIVQSWRTTEFSDSDPHSEIEVLFEALPEGTRLTLHHRKLQDGADQYKQGWLDHYFEPMTVYFGSL